MTEKQVVIITGASKGIGRATARLFCSKGYTVYGLARSTGDVCVPRCVSPPVCVPEGGRESAQRDTHGVGTGNMCVPPHGFKLVLCDITDSSKLKEAIDSIFTVEKRIDILVNNAGAGISGSVEKTAAADVRRLFDINFFSLFEAVKYTVPYMRAGGRGKIINIGSVAGSMHVPFQAFYSASKAAVEALSHCLRGELEPFNIKVTTILPGDTRTAFTSAREKNYETDDSHYGSRIARSIKLMEKDELRGMPPEKTAQVIFKAACSINPGPLYPVGVKYKIFLLLNKLLPKCFIQFVLNMIYAK